MITETQSVLLKFIASHLFGAELPETCRAEWEALLHEALAQAVFPMFFSAAQPYLPADYLSKARSVSFRYLASGVRNANQHGNLHRLLTGNGIPYVIMKGMASASYYPDPLLRVMGDVDFYVPKERIPEAKELFLREGYQFNEKSDQHAHLAFHKADEILEMHPDAGGLPSGEKGDLCRSYFADLLEKAQPYTVQGDSFLVPSPFHHGLIMLLHTAKHMINTGVGLRHLCDWAVFVGKIGDAEFRELFEEKLKAVGLWRFARTLTQLSVRYLGCPEREWAAEETDGEFLKAVMEDIFAAGNFGVKDAERINEAKLMTTEETRTVDGSKHVLLRALTEKAYRRMPVCKKVKILLPVGWLVVGVRHLYLILRGKRPSLHVGKMVSGAKKRKSIYSRFELFQ